MVGGHYVPSTKCNDEHLKRHILGTAMGLLGLYGSVHRLWHGPPTRRGIHAANHFIQIPKVHPHADRRAAARIKLRYLVAMGCMLNPNAYYVVCTWPEGPSPPDNTPAHLLNRYN